MLFPFNTPTGQAICDIEFVGPKPPKNILKAPKPNQIVIVTELPDNRGMSITEGFEFLFPQVVQFWEVDLGRPFFWIEHYLNQGYSLVSYDLVGGRAYNPKRQVFDILTLDNLFYGKL
jgi:hypothetical protein